jgi:hypothetical protein
VRHYCTYFDSRYLVRGFALFSSLREQSKEPFTLWILCFDDLTFQVLERLSLTEVKLIPGERLEVWDKELQKAKRNRNRIEYYWTCTPILPLYVLSEDPTIDLITYIDADLFFFGDPQPLFEELGDKSILIFEHRYVPEYAVDESVSGKYNVGMISFRKDKNGLKCLHWWRERCLEWCLNRSEDGKFGDQKYLDEWPTLFDGVVVSQHKGADLAPWNLANYSLRPLNSSLLISGKPIIFYHFHGFQKVGKNIVFPAYYDYRLPAKALNLYRSYACALENVSREVGTIIPAESATSRKRSLFSWVVGLLRQRWLLVSPRWLSTILWSVGEIWGRGNHIILKVGRRKYSEQCPRDALNYFMHETLRHPFVWLSPRLYEYLVEMCARLLMHKTENSSKKN